MVQLLWLWRIGSIHGEVVFASWGGGGSAGEPAGVQMLVETLGLGLYYDDFSKHRNCCGTAVQVAAAIGTDVHENGPPLHADIFWGNAGPGEGRGHTRVPNQR